MITNNDSRMGGNVQLIGLSTDQKPTDVSPNSLFLELDTMDVYFYTDMGWTKAGESAKQGIVSVSISPAIESDPIVESLFPLAFPQDISSYMWCYTPEALDDETEYTITVTPSADWCCYDAVDGQPLPKGHPRVETKHPENGVLSFDAYAFDFNTGDYVVVALQIGMDQGGTQ